MALPLFMLKALQMRLTMKIALTGVFCVTFVTIAFDILRTIQTINNSGAAGETPLWTNLESAVTVIVSCLPSYASLFSPKAKLKANKTHGPYNNLKNDSNSARNKNVTRVRNNELDSVVAILHEPGTP